MVSRTISQACANRKRTYAYWVFGRKTIAILQRIERKIDIMADKIQKHADAQDAALAELSTNLDGVAQGITNLDKLITEFQNSPDVVTSADQGRLDKIQAATKELIAKTQALKIDVDDVPKAGAPVVIPPTDPVAANLAKH